MVGMRNAAILVSVFQLLLYLRAWISTEGLKVSCGRFQAFFCVTGLSFR